MRDVNRTFNKLIIIEKREIVKRGIGEKEIWSPAHEIYAEVNNLYGNEYYAAKSLNEENTLVITCRYSALIDCINSIDYRLRFDGKVLDIKHIDNMRYKNNLVKIKGLERGRNKS